MAIKKIDHVVIRVNDLDQAIETYRDTFGLKLDRRAEHKEMGIEAAIFPLADDAFLELVTGLGPETPVAKALAGRGEGVHTVALAVDDMAATVKDLQAKGVKLINAENPEGPVFVHPKAANGVMLQLVKR